MKVQKTAIIFLIVGVFLIIIAPFLFTRNFGLLNFGSPGKIGDTIGGITAPISGLIGSILVYLALRAQIDANSLIQTQFEDQKKEDKYHKSYLYISNQVEFVRQEIDNILYNKIRTKGKVSQQIDLKGTSAINETLHVCAKINQNHFDGELLVEFPNLTKIRLLLEKCEAILDIIERFNFLLDDKGYLQDSVKFVYQMNLKPYLTLHEEERMSKSTPCERCGEKHDGIPEEIYSVFDRINLKYSM